MLERNHINHLIELNQVGYAYHTYEGETPALSDVSFYVDEGEFVAVVGASGCGKSTLLSLLAGLIKPEQGVAEIRGDLTFGYMLQTDQLLEYRTIEKNILLGLEIQHRMTEENVEYIMQKTKEYGLDKFLKSKPSQLSGGMRQRAALLRTMAVKPDVLLLDEPFSALDYRTRLNVGNDIGEIIRGEKKTAVLVTHDLSEAISLSDRVIVLSSRPGRVIREITLEFEPELTPLQRRNQPLFQEYFNEIWEAFKDE